MNGIFSAVYYMHDMHVIHRDIKLGKNNINFFWFK